MLRLIDKNWMNFKNNNLVLANQDHSKATYYPKRTLNDSYISLEDDIFCVERFIRAVSKPFGGAKLVNYETKKEIIIHRASIFDFNEFHFETSSNGTVVHKFQSSKFLLKLKGGLLLVHEFEGLVNLGDIFDRSLNSFQRFSRNSFGRFDV